MAVRAWAGRARSGAGCECGKCDAKRMKGKRHREMRNGAWRARVVHDGARSAGHGEAASARRPPEDGDAAGRGEVRGPGVAR